MSRPYQRQEERDFDDWFYAQPKASQDKFRVNGVLPYCEQRSDDQVFEIKPNHPAWSTIDEHEPRTESERFISETELRNRLTDLFRILDRFADGRMRLHLLFIRTMLGENTGTYVTRLCKQYGMTKQAAAYRARMMRRALGNIAIGQQVWKLGKSAGKRKPKEKKKTNGSKLHNENIHRKEGTTGLLRLRKMEGKLCKQGRQTKGLRKGEVSSRKGEEETQGKGMERQKQGKAFKSSKDME